MQVYCSFRIISFLFSCSVLLFLLLLVADILPVCSCSQSLPFTLNFVYSSPPLSVSFSSSNFCQRIQWIHKLTLYFVLILFIYIHIFFERSCPMKLPTKQTRGYCTGFTYLSVPLVLVSLWCCVRTDSDVLAKTKIYYIHRLPNCLTNGAAHARLRRAELRYYLTFFTPQ